MIGIYTGIGSRETPAEMLVFFSQLSFWLGARGWALRSGGAGGADSAFEQGATQAGGAREIYLPWRGFNGSASPLFSLANDAAAAQIAERIHPAWDRLSQGARKLHARNIYQVLGMNLATPSKFLLCWTPDALDKGGTRTAIVLAREHAIPVFNFADPLAYPHFSSFIETVQP